MPRNDFQELPRFSITHDEDALSEARAHFASLAHADPGEFPPERHPAIDAVACPDLECAAKVGTPCFSSTIETVHFNRVMRWDRRWSK